jgi:hypothetical protein
MAVGLFELTSILRCAPLMSFTLAPLLTVRALEAVGLRTTRGGADLAEISPHVEVAATC